jgi:hypothetical protein
VSFYDELLGATEKDRSLLLALPFIRDGAKGALTLADYLAFLEQAYHHVKHTLPLLMACGARLPAHLAWLRIGMAEYIKDETGHEQWILNDISACGGDAAAVQNGTPELPAELLVAYAYDVIARVNPAGFLGMALVLEGTSTIVASRAAEALMKGLELPPSAFTYLASHGALDVGHTEFFATLVNRIDTPEDRAVIVHCAKVFYRLYGDVFRALDRRRGVLPALDVAA